MSIAPFSVGCSPVDLRVCPNPTLQLAVQNADSVGGIVELVVSGCPAGLGEPVFDKLDALLAHYRLHALASLDSVATPSAAAWAPLASVRALDLTTATVQRETQAWRDAGLTAARTSVVSADSRMSLPLAT